MSPGELTPGDLCREWASWAVYAARNKPDWQKGVAAIQADFAKTLAKALDKGERPPIWFEDEDKTPTVPPPVLGPKEIDE